MTLIQQVQQFTTENRRELVRFAKFVVVGTIGFIIDFGILSLLHLAFGVPELIANVFSFTAAVISNFLWNRFWIYPDSRGRSFRRQFAMFVVINVAGLAINTLVFAVTLFFAQEGLDLLNNALNLAIPHDYDYVPAKLVATAVVLFWNFFINRYWTFNDVD